ncbi:MAG: YggS family pyridoxal phosphate-dependent enzyme [Pseudomonadota bacterium]
MTRITEHLDTVVSRVANAANVANRDPESIEILAVSKRHSVESIVSVAESGQRSFGENYADEGVRKVQAIARPDLSWHFIGAIQSNKTRSIATHFDWVHTVDRIKIAQRLSDQRGEQLAPLSVCIQVNVDEEPQKAGVAVGQIASLAQSISELPNLRLRGLMCLPRARDSLAEQRQPFAKLAALFAELAETYPEVDTLSMGMSGDLEAAILEGATIVRVGTAIFGPRP